jgi:hypothetical protein
MPVTTPDEASTVAVPVAELAHVPPDGELERVVVEPTQVLAVPEMAVGNGLTVTTAVRIQPVDKM